MSAPYDGFRSLGQVIAGTGAPAQGTDPYLQGMASGYKVQTAGYGRDKAREEARLARLRAVARESLPQAMAEAGYRPVDAAILGGNTTASLSQLGDFARPGTEEALDLATAALAQEDLASYNDQMALARGQQRTPYRVAGGGNVVLRADTGDVAMTDLGEAAQRATEALAGARNASAAASEARADLTSRTDPNKPRSSGGAPSEAEVLAQARERIAGGANPQQVAEYLRAKGYPGVASKIYRE